MAKILIIDDDHLVLTSIRMVLAYDDHEVLTASDGEEGIRICNEEPVDLVITDLKMPEKNGLEVIEHLQQNHPDTPIIAVSAYHDFYFQARQAGVARVLAKPFGKDMLAEMVEEALSQQ